MLFCHACPTASCRQGFHGFPRIKICYTNLSGFAYDNISSEKTSPSRITSGLVKLISVRPAECVIFARIFLFPTEQFALLAFIPSADCKEIFCKESVPFLI